MADVGALVDGKPLLGSTFLEGRRFTVQDGGNDPLLAYDTSALPTWAIAGVGDLGGCGADASPGFGLAIWTGTEWRRLSRGVQATMAPAATIVLDYWKSPTRIRLTGSTATPTRFLIDRARIGHQLAIGKPGLTTALLSAFAVNMQGNTSATDLALVGPSVALFEVLDGASVTQVQT